MDEGPLRAERFAPEGRRRRDRTESRPASFAQPKTTLAFTVAGGSAQIRNLKLWKTTK